MKKISLLLFATIFVNVMGWAQTTMNPYAYDLQSTWNPSTKKLNLSFKLNAQPNLNDGGSYGNSAGIMVKLVASDGREYKVIPIRTADIKNGNVYNLSYNYEIDFANYKNTYGNLLPEGIPAGTDLTWTVDVAGESSDKGRRSPLVTCWNAAYRPVSTHGVAVSKGYNSADFGRIYATVYNNNSEDIIQSRYTWLKNKTPSVINYEPMYLATDGQIPTTYTADGFKSSYDPHRVRVSDDGRMFVSSQWSGDRSVVWECTNGVYKGIITRTSSNGIIVAMDVRGTGDNLKLLLCEMIVNYSQYSNSNQPHARLIIHEYNIGKSTTARSISDSDKQIYYNDYRTDNQKAGMIYQGFTGNWQSVKTEGMISIAYGKNNSIWLKMDFGSSSIKPRVVYFDGTNNCANHYDTGNSTYSGMKGTSLPNAYGGSGILVFDDNLITAYPDYVSFYKYDESGILTKRYDDLKTISGTFRGIADWVNDLAIDPANNVYAVSSDAMNLMVISLPYSGLTTTNAPDEYKFKVPYPASNLQYAPVEGKNQYKFTFNVDATPRTVDVRFYTTKEQMLKGGNDYAFHYSAFKTVAKSTMSVTFDAVKGTISNKELNDPDGNGVLNLPPGEYYWCVCVNGTATPSSDKYCYIPERLSHDMDDTEMNRALAKPNGLDLYRPFQGGMFNTICLPFTLDLNDLPDNHPLKGAALKEYKGLQLQGGVGEEKVLELIFADVDGGIIRANTPYLLQPKENYNSIIRFATPFELTSTTGGTVYHEDETNTYSISYQGVIPLAPTVVDGESLTLILVADNRLAVLTGAGDMYGFRGYFQLNKPLPRGMQTRITTSKGTTTNTTIVVDGKKVNVNKFLREGRVYIRMGESLYTVDGQLVK